VHAATVPPERSNSYALLIYNSAESFGEVAVLLDFAAAIRSEYESVFLSLEPPNPRALPIEAEGHASLFLFEDEGVVNDALVDRLFAFPPRFCVASDYSQFNVWRSVLPGVIAGEALMTGLRNAFGVRSAVSDLAGLSLECSVPLAPLYDRVLVTASGYTKAGGDRALSDSRIRVIDTCRPPSERRIARRDRFSSKNKTVFISYPRPRGWSGAGDGFAALWLRAVERSLAGLDAVNRVAFEEMAPLSSNAEAYTLLEDTASVSEVNAWLATTDAVITPNWCSTLAARATTYGARTLVTFNDAGTAGLRQDWLPLLSDAERELVRTPAFHRWLPPTFASCWPGVEAGLTAMIRNVTAVPLFRSDEFEAVLVTTLNAAGGARATSNGEPALRVARELAVAAPE
jgi:hypothetical protein